MSYMLPHLSNGWQVDQAILSEEERLVMIRFGHDWDPACMKMDETLFRVQDQVKNFAIIYLVREGIWAWVPPLTVSPKDLFIDVYYY